MSIQHKHTHTHTFCASSEQHDSLHLVSFLVLTSLPIDRGVLSTSKNPYNLFAEKPILLIAYLLEATVVIFVVEAAVVTATAVVVAAVGVTFVFGFPSMFLSLG